MEENIISIHKQQPNVNAGDQNNGHGNVNAL